MVNAEVIDKQTGSKSQKDSIIEVVREHVHFPPIVPVKKRKKGKFLEEKIIEKGYIKKYRFTAPEILTTYELKVLLSVLSLYKKRKFLEAPIVEYHYVVHFDNAEKRYKEKVPFVNLTFKLSDICKELGITNNSNNHKSIIDALERLRLATFTWFLYSKKDRDVVYTINSTIIADFQTGLTAKSKMDMNVVWIKIEQKFLNYKCEKKPNLLLVNKDIVVKTKNHVASILAYWLQGQKQQVFKEGFLFERINMIFVDERKSNKRIAIRKACEELKKIGFLKSYSIDKKDGEYYYTLIKK